MKKIVLLLVIAAFMVAGIFSPAVSAAGTADGKEILDKDYVPYDIYEFHWDSHWSV